MLPEACQLSGSYVRSISSSKGEIPDMQRYGSLQKKSALETPNSRALATRTPTKGTTQIYRNSHIVLMRISPKPAPRSLEPLLMDPRFLEAAISESTSVSISIPIPPFRGNLGLSSRQKQPFARGVPRYSSAETKRGHGCREAAVLEALPAIMDPQWTPPAW